MRLLPVTRAHPLRFFPTEGKGATTIVLPTPDFESLQFLEVLGKTRIAILLDHASLSDT